MRRHTAFLGMILLAAPVAAAPDRLLPDGALRDDPLQSPFLPTVLQLVLPEGARVRFDDRVKVDFPAIAENQRQFPVQVDARAVPGVKRIIVFADLNPIQQAVQFTPHDAEAFIALRIKLDQRTPVRAAVEVADGSWLLAGGWIDAAGGGCSAPPVSRVKGDWAQSLMQLRGRLWTTPAGVSAAPARLALAVRHPMDTGFVDNIPSYWLERVAIRSNTGRLLADLELNASVAEDPAIMLMPHLREGEGVTVAGRDSGGVEMAAAVAGQSSLPPTRLAGTPEP
ncbi:MAG: quinoprotein dehydrogenase-associated SoxYZ-like carrier [Alphaproteobacteria bacterium]|nr:quinoprotein dehydrogenase-associated SoxYZ-like carrier [Alphaproteobacteria bacterium]